MNKLYLAAAMSGAIFIILILLLVFQDNSGGNNVNTSETTTTALDQVNDLSDYFYYEEISPDVEERITGISYPEDCEVPLEDLRYVKVRYYNFYGNINEGELIVNKVVAQDIVDIFKELYRLEYPIANMVLIDEYNADDELSMEANNTSSFCYRNIDGTDILSDHAYGLAIDINPLYNPYVRTNMGDRNVLPLTATDYVDRTLDFEGKIDHNDAAYIAFTNRGWKWGGDWETEKDYQHFYFEIE